MRLPPGTTELVFDDSSAGEDYAVLRDPATGLRYAVSRRVICAAYRTLMEPALDALDNLRGLAAREAAPALEPPPRDDAGGLGRRRRT